MLYSTLRFIAAGGNVDDIDLREQVHSSHRGAFFRSWLQDPIGVASIAPSGRLLAKLMAEDIGPGARVIELGAGTGTLTQALLANGVEPRHLHLVEQNESFVRILRRRFPDTHVLPVDAARLAAHLPHLVGRIDFVISGLPIVWFRREAKIRVLEGAFKLLGPTGRFHQFTYLGRPPVGSRILKALGLRASLAGFAPLNMPPAFVYRFERA